MALSRKLKHLRLMKPGAREERAGDAPKAAPSAKAVSFVAVVSMPRERQADLVLAQRLPALPIGRRRRRRVTKFVIRARPDDQVVQEDQPVHRIVRMPKVAANPSSPAVNGIPEEGRPRIDEMPAPPAAVTSVQLIRTGG